jgi:hypothetical protein
MNVFQFFIEARTKKTVAVKEQFIKDFKNNSSHPTKYIEDIKNKWNSKKAYLKIIFDISYLVVGGSREGVDYHIFDMNLIESGCKDKIKLDVIVISEIDIDDSINVVIKDIKGIFKNGKIKILKNNFIYLYPYNNDTGDIYATSHKIKAGFANMKIDIPEWIRLLVFLLITLVSGYIIFLAPGKIEDKIMEISIFTSFIVVIISELIIKIIPLLTKKHISINNLSDLIRPTPRQEQDDPYARPDDIDIENPPEGRGNNE